MKTSSTLITRLKTAGLPLLVVFGITTSALPTFALSTQQKRVLDSGIYHLNTDPEAIACSPGSGSLIGNDNAEKVWNFLTGKGLSPEQAAGVMGNLQQESGFDPFNQQNGVTWPGGGWGIAQWTNSDGPGGRRDSVRDAVIAALGEQFYVPTEEAGALIGTPAEDQLLAFQLDYLYNESNQRRMRDDPNTIEWIGLTQVATVEEAVNYWLYNFERAGDPATEDRIRFANDILTQFGSGTAPPTSGGGCELSADGCPTEPVGSEQMTDVQGISVHPCISAEVERVLNLANAQGLDMSGSGWRSSEAQIALRRAHCGESDYDIYEKPAGECEPPTAIPGTSLHERGTAVDFTCDGVVIGSQGHPCFTFLLENTGLINLPREPWHWSISGG